MPLERNHKFKSNTVTYANSKAHSAWIDCQDLKLQGQEQAWVPKSGIG